MTFFSLVEWVKEQWYKKYWPVKIGRPYGSSGSCSLCGLKATNKRTHTTHLKLESVPSEKYEWSIEEA